MDVTAGVQADIDMLARSYEALRASPPSPERARAERRFALAVIAAGGTWKCEGWIYAWNASHQSLFRRPAVKGKRPASNARVGSQKRKSSVVIKKPRRRR